MTKGDNRMDFLAILSTFACDRTPSISLKNQPETMTGQKDGFKGERAYVLPPAYIAQLETHPIGKQLYLTDIGYYPTASNHLRQRREPIEQWVLIYCRSGKGWYSIGGTKYDVGPDSYFVLPPGIPHAYAADSNDPWTIYWVHYKGTSAQMLTPHAVGPTAIRTSHNSRITDRINLFEEIMSTLLHGYSIDALIYACSTLSYFLTTLKYIDNYRAAKPTENDGDKNGKDDTTDTVIRYMSENMDRQIRLADIASYAGLTPTYLAHLFSERTGLSPMSYLRQLRITQACRYLDFTDMHINQICHKVGINDPYYFSRVFTATMGIPPSEYRKRPKG